MQKFQFLKISVSKRIAKFLVLFLIGAIITACTELNLSNSGEVGFEMTELSDITFVDTFNITCHYDSTEFLSVADYPPVFIGRLSDTVLIDHRSEFSDYYEYSWTQYNAPDLFALEVLVDTTRIMPNSNPITLPVPIPGDIIDPTERQGFCAYPVFMMNQTSDTISVGYGKFIPLILEAKDSTGNWRPLEVSYIYDCGTGLNTIFLPPGNTLITSCKIYQGDYQTSLRLKFGFEWFNYSNQFTGSIDYGQFELKKRE
ncbi:MAG: hypothetical protein DWQ02_01995 [Bacteroidetes bacterium]|nr:MAG: hypothetical protein DWQ02_01995 [Bacteroidota bacterium]